MDDNEDTGVKINLISSRKLDSMSSREKLRFILDEIKKGTVLVLERGLTAQEEIDLIKTTMSEINHQTFIGIEMQSYSSDDLVANSFFSKLLRRTRVPKMSVIGPANLLKTIHKNGNIIQTMVLTGQSIVGELAEPETEPELEQGAETEPGQPVGVPSEPGETSESELNLETEAEAETELGTGADLESELLAEPPLEYTEEVEGSGANEQIETGTESEPAYNKEQPPLEPEPTESVGVVEAEDYTQYQSSDVPPPAQPVTNEHPPAAQAIPAQPQEPAQTTTTPEEQALAQTQEPNDSQAPSESDQGETPAPNTPIESEQQGTGFLYKRLKEEEE